MRCVKLEMLHNARTPAEFVAIETSMDRVPTLSITGTVSRSAVGALRDLSAAGGASIACCIASATETFLLRPLPRSTHSTYSTTTVTSTRSQWCFISRACGSRRPGSSSVRLLAFAATGVGVARGWRARCDLRGFQGPHRCLPSTPRALTPGALRRLSSGATNGGPAGCRGVSSTAASAARRSRVLAGRSQLERGAVVGIVDRLAKDGHLRVVRTPHEPNRYSLPWEENADE